MPGLVDEIKLHGSLPLYANGHGNTNLIRDVTTGPAAARLYLFIAVSAMHCGMNSFSDSEDFRDDQIDWLHKWIKMPDGVPRAQTFSNIFTISEPDLFNRRLTEHIGALYTALKRQIAAIDGKRLRGSHGLDTEACHVVSSSAAKSGLTLALKGNQQSPQGSPKSIPLRHPQP